MENHQYTPPFEYTHHYLPTSPRQLEPRYSSPTISNQGFFSRGVFYTPTPYYRDVRVLQAHSPCTPHVQRRPTSPSPPSAPSHKRKRPHNENLPLSPCRLPSNAQKRVRKESSSCAEYIQPEDLTSVPTTKTLAQCPI